MTTILRHLTDAALINELESPDVGARKAARLLLDIPITIRAEIQTEARERTNRTGERFTESLRTVIAMSGLGRVVNEGPPQYVYRRNGRQFGLVMDMYAVGAGFAAYGHDYDDESDGTGEFLPLYIDMFDTLESAERALIDRDREAVN